MQHSNKSAYTKVMVIGAGAWGSALASIISYNIPEVFVYDRNALPNEPNRIPTAGMGRVIYTSDLSLLSSMQLLVLAIPAQAVRGMLDSYKQYISPSAAILIASKGIESDTLLLMSDIVAAILPTNPIAVISGPNFAKEIASGLPAATVVASRSQSVGLGILDILNSAKFKVCYSDDVIGTQVCGATKNVIAIAAGIARGMKLGMNVHAAIITIGLDEMTKLAIGVGGRMETMIGFAGIGDLVLTSSSTLSRNMSFGLMLAEGKSMQEILQPNATYEGYHSALAIYRLGKSLNLELAIVEAVYRIVHKNSNIYQEFEILMGNPIMM